MLPRRRIRRIRKTKPRTLLPALALAVAATAATPTAALATDTAARGQARGQAVSSGWDDYSR
ncbi:hypothetical protein GTZ78_56180, partial [Streptomyces sp. SID8361]|nr:hypothetical protein [Streptomyces sp. SID8361]